MGGAGDVFNRRGGGVQSLSCMVVATRPLHSHNAGTEHVGFSPTRQIWLALSPKRCEVFGASHEG